MKLHSHGSAVSVPNNVQAPQLELSFEYLQYKLTLATPLISSVAVAVIVNGVEVCQYGIIVFTDEVGGVVSSSANTLNIVVSFTLISTLKAAYTLYSPVTAVSEIVNFVE